MGDTGKQLGKAVGRTLGKSDKIPLNEESAENAGEVVGEMAEAGVKMVADRISE